MTDCAQKPFTRGIHHLVFCTDDMKKTVDFYADVIGAPLIHAMKVPAGLGTGPKNRGNPPYERCRHYFFDMGNDTLLAFFEIPQGVGTHDRNTVGACQHCAFVVSAEKYAALESRLNALGVTYLPSTEQGPGMYGIYLYDPNGIRLEFACQLSQGPNQRIVDYFTQSQAAISQELSTLQDATAEWITRRTAHLPGT
jgi:catechol 2,3-dioxygenase-like lactoylglutathione lyase family enzyme